jgi:hypothetical protein
LQTRFLVALRRVKDLLLSAKDLFVAANGGKLPPLAGSPMSNGTVTALNSAQDLAAGGRLNASLSRGYKALAYP